MNKLKKHSGTVIQVSLRCSGNTDFLTHRHEYRIKHVHIPAHPLTMLALSAVRWTSLPPHFIFTPFKSPWRRLKHVPGAMMTSEYSWFKGFVDRSDMTDAPLWHDAWRRRFS